MQVKLAVAVTVLAGCAAASAAVFPYRFETHTLANGLKVILVPMPAGGLVAYYSVVRTGSRDEVEPGHTGFAHFFEHMMFRGTERFPAGEYDRLITAMGANANAYTTDDYTCYHLTFAAEDLPRVMELEADRFQNLAYSEQDFQTEAGAVYGEYRKGRTNPFEVLEEALRATAFDAHTYKHTTMGFEADIAAMPTMLDYSRRFFARYYRPDNVVIVIAGDFDPAAALELVRRHYGAWKPGYQAPQVPVEPEQTAPRRVEMPYEGRTLPLLAIMWKSPAFDPADPRVAAGLVLGELLAGDASPLYRELVLERRTVQRLLPAFQPSRDPGLWGVIAMVADEGELADVEASVTAAVSTLAAGPVPVERLEGVKKRLRYSFLMSLETPDAVAGALAPMIALSGGAEAVDTLFATLASLTPGDVQAAARALLRPERSTVAVLTGRS
ncbi:MAG: insulinase family protein [Acidobacteriota bacterium]|jgi:zinc protease